MIKAFEISQSIFNNLFQEDSLSFSQQICKFKINKTLISCTEWFRGVPRGSVVRCLTRNPGVLGSSLTTSSGFFRGSVLGQDTSEPSLVLVKPRKA